MSKDMSHFIYIINSTYAKSCKGLNKFKQSVSRPVEKIRQTGETQNPAVSNDMTVCYSQEHIKTITIIMIDEWAISDFVLANSDFTNLLTTEADCVLFSEL